MVTGYFDTCTEAASNTLAGNYTYFLTLWAIQYISDLPKYDQVIFYFREDALNKVVVVKDGQMSYIYSADHWLYPPGDLDNKNSTSSTEEYTTEFNENKDLFFQHIRKSVLCTPLNETGSDFMIIIPIKSAMQHVS